MEKHFMFEDLVLEGLLLLVHTQNKARTEAMSKELNDHISEWVMRILAFRETDADKES